MKYKNIGILGGSGFVGRRLSNHLSRLGYNVSVFSRNPNKHRQLSLASDVSVVAGNPYEPGTLENFFSDKDVVINLVGILNERRDNGKEFHHAHVDLAHRVVMACEAGGVARLLHMSALKADANKGSSYYLRSKGEAEDWAHHAAEWGLKVTSFRPSVIFGEQDSFLNRFATMLGITPLVLPLACADSRFAPIYVQDVVDAFAKALEDESTAGQRYDLCGPRIYTLKQLVEYTAKLTGKKRWIMGLPEFASYMQAWVFDKLPGQILTLDNYRSLQTDSICDEGNPGLAELGIQATSLESVAPRYLGSEHSRGRLNAHRSEKPFHHDHDSHN